MPGSRREFEVASPQERPDMARVSRAAVVITHFMCENEILRDENCWLRIALRGFDGEPRNPWPLLSSADILQILHPNGDLPLAARRQASPYRAIARVTHQLASRARPAREIKTAVLAEAARNGIAAEAALSLANDILRQKVEGARCG